MPKSQLVWEDDEQIPEEIDCGAILGISFVVSLFSSITSWWFYTEIVKKEFPFSTVFISLFLFLSVLIFFVRRNSMNQRRLHKS